MISAERRLRLLLIDPSSELRGHLRPIADLMIIFGLAGARSWPNIEDLNAVVCEARTPEHAEAFAREFGGWRCPLICAVPRDLATPRNEARISFVPMGPQLPNCVVRVIRGGPKAGRCTHAQCS